MLRRRYFPGGEWGEVRDWLVALRKNPQRRKAAEKLFLDLQVLEEFWPRSLNVTVRSIRGWEPLRELKREYDRIAYRVFFCVVGNDVWLLSAFEKKSGDTPRRELENAFGRMNDVLRARQ